MRARRQDGRNGQAETLRPVRCAIYTRKATAGELDYDRNSLNTQREAAEAYIASRRHEGWVTLPEHYDDDGYSGGTLDRPALQRLLRDSELGRVDCVVVRQADRLSRSLLDLARIGGILERNGVSFVSLTDSTAFFGLCKPAQGGQA